MLLPITDRRELLQLRDWIADLHETYEYREIAALTWRGETKFGYIQRLAKGDHLRGAIKPIRLDYQQIKTAREVLARLKRQRARLREIALDLLASSAAHTGHVVEFMQEAR